jgi:hypothetical protein
MKSSGRMYHILESIQYGMLYLATAFIGGVSLDFSFPHYDPSTPTESMARQTIFQCIFLVLVVMVTRYVVKQVPILFPVIKGTNYVPYKTAEFNGEMMMGFVFLGSQLNLIQKIDHLAEKLYTYLFDEKRVVKNKLNEKEHTIKNGLKKLKSTPTEENDRGTN